MGDTYTHVEDAFTRPFWEEGRVEGRVEMLRATLAARGLELAPPHEEALASCTDAPQFLTWITRAATATSAAEVFQEIESAS